MAAVATQSVNHNALPIRLINFFARYPPRLYGAHFTNEQILSVKEKIALRGNKKTGEPPVAKVKTSSISTSQAGTVSSTSTSASAQTETLENTDVPELAPLLDPRTSKPIFASTDKPPNPFQPYKNPASGRWRGPTVSLRRQAELFKIARVYGVEPLLPASIKSTASKEARLLSRGMDGPALRGTGPGQSVKGHKWERNMGPMLQKRIEAMEKMPELIREWRQRGNGRQWRKWPKK